MMSERTSITDGPLGFEIVVRPRRDWGLRLFMPAWLLGWTAGEVAAFYTVFTAIFGGPRPFAGPVGFIAPWLVFWTVGGAIAWMVFVYNIAGRERVSIDGTWITTSRELFRWARSVRMPLAVVPTDVIYRSARAAGDRRVRCVGDRYCTPAGRGAAPQDVPRW